MVWFLKQKHSSLEKYGPAASGVTLNSARPVTAVGPVLVALKNASFDWPSRAVWLRCTGVKVQARPRTLVSKLTFTDTSDTACGATLAAQARARRALRRAGPVIPRPS